MSNQIVYSYMPLPNKVSDIKIPQCLLRHTFTFLPSLVSSHQAESHHFGPGSVDLQLLQLRILLYVLLSGLRLRARH